MWLGGRFDALIAEGGSAAAAAADDDADVRPRGVARWTEALGLHRHPAGGFLFGGAGAPGVVSALAVDEAGGVVYAAGIFDEIEATNAPCRCLAALPFREAATAWTCVAAPAYGFDPFRAPTLLLHDGDALYVAGRAATDAGWWRANKKTVAVATFSFRAGDRYGRRRRRRRRSLQRASGGRPPSSKATPAGGPPDAPDAPSTKAAAAAKNGSALLEAATWEWLPGWRGVDGVALSVAAAPAGGSRRAALVVGGEFDDAPNLRGTQPPGRDIPAKTSTACSGAPPLHAAHKEFAP